jgi:hypothetical protein
VAASVTSSTHERKSKTNFLVKHEKIYVRLNTFADDVCIGIFWSCGLMFVDTNNMTVGLKSKFILG